MATESHPTAAVTDGFQSAIFPMFESKSVMECFATVQHTACQHLGDEFLAPYFGIRKVLIPKIKVINGCPDTAITGDFIMAGAAFKTAILLSAIAFCPVFDDDFVIIHKTGVGHSQWRKDILLGKFSQRFAAHSFHNLSHQEIARIAI